MLPLLQLVAVLAATLFTGAAIYINLVEHPARMGCSTEFAATEWGPSYRRATRMQAPLALIGGLGGLAVWWQFGGMAWLVGSLVILSVIPFTLIIIDPEVNKLLLAPGRDLRSQETRDLLVKWGRYHAVRSVLGLVGSLIYIWQTVKA